MRPASAVRFAASSALAGYSGGCDLADHRDLFAVGRDRRRRGEPVTGQSAGEPGLDIIDGRQVGLLPTTGAAEATTEAAPATTVTVPAATAAGPTGPPPCPPGPRPRPVHSPCSENPLMTTSCCKYYMITV